MLTFVKISQIVLVSIGSLLVNPLFWIVIGITYYMYGKGSDIEERMLGYRIPLWEKIKNSILIGLLGGVIGSSLSVFLGITIEQYTSLESSNFNSGILYIWIIALLLSLINVRYLCFSYAGGIVALTNLIFGFPKINPIGIIALVGILHLIESLLIWVDGYSNAVPVFLKRKDGNAVGGYIMNRIWPLPMLILFAAIVAGGVGESISMPDWWPIIRQPGLDINMENFMYILQPIPVILGYGDVAITKTPAKRCKDSAWRLAVYSVILIALAAIASKIHLFAYAAAVFAPVGHELLIIYGQKEEEDGKALFEAPERGVKVLFCHKGFPGVKMNLEPGDTIVAINNVRIDKEEDLSDFLKNYPTYIWLDIVNSYGEKKTLEYKNYERGISSLGALIVPRSPELYLEINKTSKLVKHLKGLWRDKNKKA
ncbi:MAG: hypothetical protein PHF82_08945 [Lutispora sp.]|nr:hypothetical protein [Lutispora sp.]